MATRATIEVGYVGPNQSSRIQLSQGLYSLSARSNTPFVSLIGASGFIKIFSWGEIVEVPCGQTCTVKNESYHGGDIVLNSGTDYDNCPARITVPVKYPWVGQEPPDPVTGYYHPEFPADVRRARQAFLVTNVRPMFPPSGVRLIGLRSDGSHRTNDYVGPFTLGQIKGVGYAEDISWPVGDIIRVPLGYASVPGDVAPHVLLTSALILLPQDVRAIPEELPPSSYYTMEY